MRLDVDCVIFDMDGLMYDTERLYVLSFEQFVSEKTGMTFRREDLVKFLGANEEFTKENWPRVFGTDYTCEECFALSRQWEEEWISTHGFPVKPGLYELLNAMKDRGYKMAVASGTETERVERNLQMTGVRSYFSAVIGGDQVKKSKTDPEIFLTAARILGCSEPRRAVVFEDSLNGMLAAHAGGFHCIIVPDLVDPTIGNEGKYTVKVTRLDRAIRYFKP